jgi:hypothetical protein
MKKENAPISHLAVVPGRLERVRERLEEALGRGEKKVKKKARKQKRKEESAPVAHLEGEAVGCGGPARGAHELEDLQRARGDERVLVRRRGRRAARERRERGVVRRRARRSAGGALARAERRAERVDRLGPRALRRERREEGVVGGERRRHAAREHRLERASDGRVVARARVRGQHRRERARVRRRGRARREHRGKARARGPVRARAHEAGQERVAARGLHLGGRSVEPLARAAERARVPRVGRRRDEAVERRRVGREAARGHLRDEVERLAQLESRAAAPTRRVD